MKPVVVWHPQFRSGLGQALSTGPMLPNWPSGGVFSGGSAVSLYRTRWLWALGQAEDGRTAAHRAAEQKRQIGSNERFAKMEALKSKVRRVLPLL